MTAIPRQEVLPVSEARACLTEITAIFRKEGAAAGIVVFGNRRVPEAAIVPWEIIEMLDPIIEDMVIATRIRARDAADTGVRYTLDEVLEELGLSDVDE